MDRNILRASRIDPKLSATEILEVVKSPGEPEPSLRTVRRRLQQAGLNGRRPVKKPFISLKNRRARIQWAKEHLTWTSRDWARVAWSDESKFNLFGSDGIKYIRRPIGTRFDPKYQLPTVKHGGGNCMVWGTFCAGGMGPLRRIEGILDRYGYEEILEKTMRPWALRKIGRNFLFQQDNDPKHASGHVKQWFKKRHVEVMDWPSQSPDLNIIESLWEELERALKGKRAKNAAEKFEQLKKSWSEIPQATIDKLIDSMPRRCQAVIDAKGFATKY